MTRTRSATKTQALPTTLAVARPAVLTDVDLLTIILKFASANSRGIDRMMAARVWHVSMVWSVATKAVLASLSQDHTMWSRACRRDRFLSRRTASIYSTGPGTGWRGLYMQHSAACSALRQMQHRASRQHLSWAARWPENVTEHAIRLALDVHSDHCPSWHDYMLGVEIRQSHSGRKGRAYRPCDMPHIASSWVRFERDHTDEEDMGYTVTTVPPGLREDGLWWIASVDFEDSELDMEMRRKGDVEKIVGTLQEDTDDDWTTWQLSLCLLRRTDGKLLQLVRHESASEEQPAPRAVDWRPSFVIGNAIARFDITVDARAAEEEDVAPIHIALDPREPHEKICLIESLDDLLSLLESPAAAHLWV